MLKTGLTVMIFITVLTMESLSVNNIKILKLLSLACPGVREIIELAQRSLHMNTVKTNLVSIDQKKISE